MISRSYRPVFSLAYRLLGNREEAAEATQEAYMRMVRSLRGFREVGAFATWLFRITSNVCLTQMRKRGRAEVTDLSESMDYPDTADVESAALENVFRDEVDRCLKKLPDVYRTVVVLRDIYGLSGDETARALGITEGAVKVRLHRARRKLREQLLQIYPEWGRDENSGQVSA